ncbi:hypothetical protein EYZ11_004738 [Aspergillus tanneri]|uniref:Myb-like domain-containing protein n=1 Tax=Aspergillus tanneri TaxID=1220188 RepID=A0A4S3JKA6_9EURO|nr:hypothetical protein EYZ11_004738 [Aspergillus tanneri]
MGQGSSQPVNSEGLENEPLEDIENDRWGIADTKSTPPKALKKTNLDVRPTDSSTTKRKRKKSQDHQDISTRAASTASSPKDGRISRPAKRKKTHEPIQSIAENLKADNRKTDGRAPMASAVPTGESLKTVRPSAEKQTNTSPPKHPSKKRPAPTVHIEKKAVPSKEEDTTPVHDPAALDDSPIAPVEGKKKKERYSEKGGLVGHFAPAEMTRIEGFKINFCNTHGISGADFDSMVQHAAREKEQPFPNESLISKADFWKAIYDILPNRNRRNDDDVVQRWKNRLQHRGTMKRGPWTDEEVTQFESALQETRNLLLQLGYDVGRNIYDMDESLISWGAISDKLSNSRSRQQCGDKWRKLRIKIMAERLKEEGESPPSSVSEIRHTKAKKPAATVAQLGREKTGNKHFLSEVFVDSDDGNGDDSDGLDTHTGKKTGATKSENRVAPAKPAKKHTQANSTAFIKKENENSTSPSDDSESDSEAGSDTSSSPEAEGSSSDKESDHSSSDSDMDEESRTSIEKAQHIKEKQATIQKLKEPIRSLTENKSKVPSLDTLVTGQKERSKERANPASLSPKERKAAMQERKKSPETSSDADSEDSEDSDSDTSVNKQRFVEQEAANSSRKAETKRKPSKDTSGSSTSSFDEGSSGTSSDETNESQSDSDSESSSESDSDATRSTSDEQAKPSKTALNKVKQKPKPSPTTSKQAVTQVMPSEPTKSPSIEPSSSNESASDEAESSSDNSSDNEPVEPMKKPSQVNTKKLSRETKTTQGANGEKPTKSTTNSSATSSSSSDQSDESESANSSEEDEPVKPITNAPSDSGKRKIQESSVKGPKQDVKRTKLAKTQSKPPVESSSESDEYESSSEFESASKTSSNESGRGTKRNESQSEDESGSDDSGSTSDSSSSDSGSDSDSSSEAEPEADAKPKPSSIQPKGPVKQDTKTKPRTVSSPSSASDSSETESESTSTSESESSSESKADRRLQTGPKFKSSSAGPNGPKEQGAKMSRSKSSTSVSNSSETESDSGSDSDSDSVSESESGSESEPAAAPTPAPQPKSNPHSGLYKTQLKQSQEQASKRKSTSEPNATVSTSTSAKPTTSRGSSKAVDRATPGKKEIKPPTKKPKIVDNYVKTKKNRPY